MTERVRAFRGAIQLSEDSVEEITESTVELVGEMLSRNELAVEDLVSVIFTATPDLHAGFPAAAARGLGLGSIPLLCAAELDIEAALPRVIRVLTHAYSPRNHQEVVHVYLRGAQALRQDLAQ